MVILDQSLVSIYSYADSFSSRFAASSNEIRVDLETSQESNQKCYDAGWIYFYSKRAIWKSNALKSYLLGGILTNEKICLFENRLKRTQSPKCITNLKEA